MLLKIERDKRDHQKSSCFGCLKNKKILVKTSNFSSKNVIFFKLSEAQGGKICKMQALGAL